MSVLNKGGETLNNDGTDDTLIQMYYIINNDSPIDRKLSHCKTIKSIASFLEAVTNIKQSCGSFIDLSITANRQGQGDKIPRKYMASVLW